MYSKTTRIIVAFISAIFTLVLVGGGIGPFLCFAETDATTYAETVETNEVPSSTYYYDNLRDEKGAEYTLAKKFYNALGEMHRNGDFKDGVVDYSLNKILTSDQIKEWVVDGNLTIPKAFSAARDSYYLDHPELFYIDVYKLTISAGRVNGVYSAYIDCGREANCYIDNGFSSAAQVETAINAFNSAVNTVVQYAREYAAKDTYGTAEEVLLAVGANEYLAENISYDTESYLIHEESNDTEKEAPYTHNAYGGLVVNKCVCSGYTMAFKAVLDKLNIPCVIVNGVSNTKASDGTAIAQGEAHSWNYVWYHDIAEDGAAAVAETTEQGSWYAFDVTWNSTGLSKNGYVNMDAFSTGRRHTPDPVISSSGYSMPYPELSSKSYGDTTLTDGFMHSFVYSAEAGGTDDYGNPLMTFTERISYNGKGAIGLLDDGLHMLQRFYYRPTGQEEYIWSAWFDIGTLQKNLYEMTVEDENGETRMEAFYQALYIQYAVVDVDADLNYNPDGDSSVALDFNFYYSKDFNFQTENGNGEYTNHMIFLSEIYTNKTFGTYTAPPYVSKTNPNHTGVVTINDGMAKPGTSIMADEKAFTFRVTYNEPMHILDESKPIGIDYVCAFENAREFAGFVPVNSKGDYVELTDDGYTLVFKFKPSLMYAHNELIYSFYFSNVGSSKMVATPNGERMSNKLPNPAVYHFGRAYLACSMILGGGRLWIDCCARPTLVSNSDLSAMDFKDEQGNSTFTENARSQMMLVVENVNEKTEKDMLDTITNSNDFNVDKSDIKSSETYDIKLQMCGKYPTISDGSYVKIALGFPEGYGPEDEGVTFKIFHRKHIRGDEYIIEEVPCVVTQLGIVATVSSFSPYMVAAVSADKVSASKTILANIEGKGGVLSKEDGKVRSLNKGESYTYTIKPNEGYQVYKVTLNGNDVTSKVNADGKLKLSYEELINNNDLEIQYISNEAAARYAEKDVEIVDPILMVVSTDGKAGVALKGDQLPINKLVPTVNNGTGSSTVWIVIGVIIALIVVAVVLTTLLLRRKKNNG